MGLDYSLYLGPYVVCDGQPKTTVVVKRKACNKKRCKEFKRSTTSKFCSQCGSKIENAEFEEQYDKDIAYELLNEKLTQAGRSTSAPFDKHVYYPNVKFSDNREYRIDHQIASLTSISPDDIQKETNQFIEFFKKELDILRQEYNSIEVKWGFLNYVW